MLTRLSLALLVLVSCSTAQASEFAGVPASPAPDEARAIGIVVKVRGGWCARGTYEVWVLATPGSDGSVTRASLVLGYASGKPHLVAPLEIGAPSSIARWGSIAEDAQQVGPVCLPESDLGRSYFSLSYERGPGVQLHDLRRWLE